MELLHIIYEKELVLMKHANLVPNHTNQLSLLDFDYYYKKIITAINKANEESEE
jgi:hypothetical protein